VPCTAHNVIPEENTVPRLSIRLPLAAALAAALNLQAHADSVTDWNLRAGEIVAESRLGTPPAVRVMALVQTAVLEAVSSLPAAARGSAAAVDAAVAAAHRSTLLPAQQATIEAAYQAALRATAESPAKALGLAAGERAATAVLAERADDGAAAAESYRPHAAAGAYVPTALPAVPQWPQRRPWLMNTAAQFRPAPPPSLASEAWVRDYNEVKSLGGRASKRRSAEQTEVARFWEYSLPAIYHGVVRSVATQPGRDPLRNARLFATVAQAMDDAMISVFDAKYHHAFWRPGTAIRNADLDNNPATEREASWAPLIDVPLHPEYPSAHSILASAVGTILEAEIGSEALPALSTTSPTAKGATRRWTHTDEFVREVADARIWGGLHYRFSTEAGEAMGRQIGRMAADRGLRPAH